MSEGIAHTRMLIHAQQHRIIPARQGLVRESFQLDDFIEVHVSLEHQRAVGLRGHVRNISATGTDVRVRTRMCVCVCVCECVSERVCD